MFDWTKRDSKRVLPFEIIAKGYISKITYGILRANPHYVATLIDLPIKHTHRLPVPSPVSSAEVFN